MATQTPSEPVDGEIELSIPLDQLCSIIALAREFDVKTASSDPDASPIEDDDIALATLEDRPSDPTEDELRQVIEDLSEDAQFDLVALTWLGRDDWTPDDWDELRRTAAEEASSPTAAYLMGIPLLSDFLASGLAALGLDCEEDLSRHA